METKNEGVSGTGAAVLILYLFVFVMILSFPLWIGSITGKTVERKRMDICNNTVLRADKSLPESHGSFILYESDSFKNLGEVKDETDYLEAEILESNKEVNQLKTLLSCYYDN